MKNNYKPELDKNSTVENFRKQKRFGINTRIHNRNNLNVCLLCGASFKKVEHFVLKSAKGVRLHLCGDCAKGYPTAKPYVTTTRHKLRSKV